MNLLENLELYKSTFTTSEKKAYEMIINNPIEILQLSTISALAEKLDISQPTLTRFLKKLNYNSFSDFKLDVFQLQKYHSMDNQKETHNLDHLLQDYADFILKIHSFIPNKQIEVIIQYISQANHVYITGTHKSFLSAEMLSYNLTKLGIPTSVVKPDNQFMIGAILKETDVLLIFSESGRSYVDILEDLKSKDIRVIYICSQSYKGRNKSIIDELIYIPALYLDNGRYLEMSIIYMIVGEMIISQYAECKYKEDNEESGE